jgi:hypothetical protein
MRPVELLSKLQLLREYLWILTLFGLILGATAPPFFYKTVFSMSENLSMVVENP